MEAEWTIVAPLSLYVVYDHIQHVGCDDSKVTVTPVAHPITDKQLHDMQIRIDTSSQRPIDATCRFQYILNEL